MKRMLINATQPEERRLAIVDGQSCLDYEIEIEGREQRKGNIYKAVVTRRTLAGSLLCRLRRRPPRLPAVQGNLAPVLCRRRFARPGRASTTRSEGRPGNCWSGRKEERGNKGAALTTFISLAGRYVVLMPNNPRRWRVAPHRRARTAPSSREAMDQLEYPNGMIIARTAGIGRTAPELQWDLNYLLKLWDAIDGAAKGWQGRFLIYQESSLVIRAIRDYFNNDIGDILIDTDDIYEQAHQFMAHVMPEHAARVKRYRDDAALFSRFQIEHQIESAYARTVSLPSGGAIVIDHTEALVSVDVNSARAIKGGDIEETATRTNLEAADESGPPDAPARPGRPDRDRLHRHGESKNRREVENRLRDALRQDRARVQFGTISKFGLMESSRQRLKPALSEGRPSLPPLRRHRATSATPNRRRCRSCASSGRVDEGQHRRRALPGAGGVASFLLNEKRTEIAKIELKQRVARAHGAQQDAGNAQLQAWSASSTTTRAWTSDRLQARRRWQWRPDVVTPLAGATCKADPGDQGVLPDAPAPWQKPARRRGAPPWW